MKLLLHSSVLLGLLTPVSAAQAISRAEPCRPADSRELSSRSDPSLEALRAGRVQESSALREDERAALRASEAENPGLADLRAGGIIELLLIIVLVLLIFTLI